MDYWGTGLLVFAVCTIGFTAFFFGTMPSELVYPIDRQNLKYQSYNENWVLGSTADYYRLNDTITLTGGLPFFQVFDFNTASPSVDVVFAFNFFDSILEGRKIVLYWQTWGGFFIFNPQWQPMKWEGVSSPSKTSVYKTDLLANWIPENNVSLFAKVYSDNPSVKVQFADTNTTRNNIGSAWDSGSLQACISFGSNNVTLALNALTLVTQLLFFQAWDWCHPIIMFAIDLPFWILNLYIATRIIRLFIPALSGN